MAPISFRVQIPQGHKLLLVQKDLSHASSDLPRNKVITPSRRLVVEQYAVNSKHVVEA